MNFVLRNPRHPIVPVFDHMHVHTQAAGLTPQQRVLNVFRRPGNCWNTPKMSIWKQIESRNHIDVHCLVVERAGRFAFSFPP